MLERLTIYNFQAHKKLDLELDRVTTIVGPTNVGKSAVLRALRWLCFNKPGGEAFKRRGASFAKVRLELDDGTVIVRSRGKKNQYKLDGQSLVAMGSSPPEPVTQILNLSDLSFQSQVETPLWFDETAGNVSKQLNRIVDLEVIDQALSRVKSLAADADREAANAGAALRALVDEKRRLNIVSDADVAWQRIERKGKQILKLRQRADDLKALVQQIEQVPKVNEVLLRRAAKALSKMLELKDKLAQMQANRDQLTWLISEIKSTKEELQCQRSLESSTASKIKKLKICPTCRRKT